MACCARCPGPLACRQNLRAAPPPTPRSSAAGAGASPINILIPNQIWGIPHFRSNERTLRVHRNHHRSYLRVDLRMQLTTRQQVFVDLMNCTMRCYSNVTVSLFQMRLQTRIVGNMIMTEDDRSVKAPSWQGRRPVKERFGSRLYDLRTSRGYTQMELAMRASLDRSFLSDMERGVKEPTLTTLDTLAKAFTLTLSEFLDTI